MKGLSTIIWGGLTVSMLLQQYTIVHQQISLDLQRQSIANLLKAVEGNHMRLALIEARENGAARTRTWSGNTVEQAITALAYDGATQTWVPVADPSCQTHRSQQGNPGQVVWRETNTLQGSRMVTPAGTLPGGEMPGAQGTIVSATGTNTVIVAGGQ